MKFPSVQKGLLLGAFAVLTTGIVALTHALTEDKIAESVQQVLLTTLDQVVPEHLHDNSLPTACHMLTAPDYLGTAQPRPAFLGYQNGKPTVLAIEAIAPNGYNGNISLIVGMRKNGTITGVRVLEHQETPGLGDNVEYKKTHWVDQFIGKRFTPKNAAQWHVKKDGGQFDQFTGATITPRAVVGAVTQVQRYYRQQGWQHIAHSPSCDGEQ